MSEHVPHPLAVERRETGHRQARAAEPSISAWVSANAGTGKTHVLTNRVLRLLVAGTPPERLLCLTYTKAAAAEMSSRVFDRLSRWVTADAQHLGDALASLLGRKPEPEEIERARDLFTRAIETPGGLKVQTIHAFCERLLQRFPLEAGVPAGFAILDEETTGSLVREAVRHVLEAAIADPEGDLGRSLATAVRYATDDGFDSVLAEAMGKREWLEFASRLDTQKRRGLDAAELLYRRSLGLSPEDTAGSIEAARAQVLKTAELTRLRDLLASGSKTDVANAAIVAAAIAARSDAARSQALCQLFLTQKGGPRERLMTARLASANPEIDASLTLAQTSFTGLTGKLGCIVIADATMALMRLSFAAMQRYRDLKAARAALDFDDLIRAADSLLRFGEDAQWVLYKLDGGLDHILVDEAQDTSPRQWSIVKSLAREFLAGLGARELDTGLPRTVFAVGDEKQSIYGFQGAAPRMFAEMGQYLEAEARAAGLAFERIPLTLSFRTVAPVLEAVDAIFADPVRGAGLSASGERAAHVAHRFGMGGLVELWETEKPDDADPAPAWKPLDEQPRSEPSHRLAERIAETIEAWKANGEMLVSEGRPVAYGDILVLVRSRRPLADLIVSALKRRGIPVAGADRLRLTEQLAVKDIMALADVLLLPEDDLALAAVLKSPLFGLDDDDLIALAPGRPGSLWSALLAAARANQRFAPAAEQLKRWRARADIVPPFEFLVEVLVHDGMRKRLLGRLGSEAADPLDELVALALAYDEQAPPSLQGFMDWLRASDREIKRDMEHSRDEVRVMTVHGSKGLEAPIVILPDTCRGPSGGRAGGLLARAMDLPAHDPPEPFLWPVKGTAGVAAISDARAQARARDGEEHNRLLYVALTRARDRLYVAGFEGGRGRDPHCWYDAVEAGLAGRLVAATDHAGRPVRRLAAPQVAKPAPHGERAGSTAMPEPPPPWATAPPPREPRLALPLAPSRLAPLDVDAEGDPLDTPRRALSPDDPPAPSPASLAGGNRFLRGTVTHALLQHLPAVDPDRRREAAVAYVAARGSALGARVRASIVAETLAVLAHPHFAAVFGPGSRAEVPVAAELTPPDGTGRPVRLVGQIDRLVATAHEVLIIDFKTNRPPPTEVERVPEAYVLQLAAYRLAVSRIFPGKAVRAALLWTDGPDLMELPSDRLDDAAKRLFLLGDANLDH